MKILLKTAIMIVILSVTVVGQFKPRPETMPTVSESMIRPDGGGLLFGWFDPSRVSLHNSYTLSYTTSGSKGFSLGTLTSSLGYQISDPLSVRFDVSLMHSPYNNLGGRYTNDFSGVYLTRAELNYRPSKNTLLQIQYRQLPAMYWFNSYDRFGFMPDYYRFDEEEIH